MIIQIFQIFLLLVPISCSGNNLDVNLLEDLTINFTVHYSATCLKLLHPYDEPRSGNFELYVKLYKKLISSPQRMVGMYSYEELLQMREKPGYRRRCSKPLKVTIAEDASRKGFAKFTYDYPMSNSLWLIILNNVTIEEYFENAKLPFDVEIVTASIMNPDFVNFHEIYKVGIRFPMRIKYFGNWTKSEGMNITKSHVYSRRSNLEGKLFNIGYGDNWPVIYINRTRQLDGYFAKIWFELEGLMNITSRYKRSNDGSVGRHTSKGNWTGLMGMLLDKEIDVIVSDLTISSDRQDVIDFATPLIASSYQIYFRFLGNNLEWTAVFRPLAANVWLSIIAYILVASISLALCNYMSLIYGLESHKFKHFGPVESFFFVLQSLCQQGYGNVPKSSSSRIIFLMSYLVSAILIPSYSASLISSLANQTPIKLFDSLKEMVKDGSYHLIVGRNTAEFVYFSKANDEIYKSAYEKLIKNVPTKYGKNLNVSNGNEYAILCEWPKFALFGVELLIRMKTESSNQKFCKITSFSQPIAKVYQSFGLRKNSPYSGLIDYHLNRMKMSGLIKRLEKSVLQQPSKYGNPDYTGVDLAEIFHFFVFLSVGIVLTTMLLFYEKVRSKRKIDSHQREKTENLEMFKNYQKLYHSYLEYYR